MVILSNTCPGGFKDSVASDAITKLATLMKQLNPTTTYLLLINMISIVIMRIVVVVSS